MKKLLSAFIVFTLLFSPAGNFISFNQDHTVSAKGFRSGGGFKSPSMFKQKKSYNNYNKFRAYRKPASSTRGSFMRGLFFGGLTGLLFGSMFSHMGAFGSLLGLMVNIIGLFILFYIIRKLFRTFAGR
ncbi:hypothetical protein LRR81_14765 [Metabacillus sp. GX 13764]|uniref:hypothetical protein n=1 Tax=Metabacillus kandeliae TaxID=2900151 RepID=UPI001E51E8B4|nr:hypothetical protein [Metabacillus kandeliae]MCD7035505.1 hypothetical protein [Metabacillus kandeliae]